jgi:hypothetical protein
MASWLMDCQSSVPSGLLRYTARAFEAVEIESRRWGIEDAIALSLESISDPVSNRVFQLIRCWSEGYLSDFEPLQLLQAATRLSRVSSLCFENGKK